MESQPSPGGQESFRRDPRDIVNESLAKATRSDVQPSRLFNLDPQPRPETSPPAPEPTPAQPEPVPQQPEAPAESDIRAFFANALADHDQYPPGTAAYRLLHHALSTIDLGADPNQVLARWKEDAALQAEGAKRRQEQG